MKNGATPYPTIDDKQMTELEAFHRQLHALLGPNGIFNHYTKPSVHEVGISLKQAQLLAHDIEFMCCQLREQYEQAESDEQAARLLQSEE